MPPAISTTRIDLLAQDELDEGLDLGASVTGRRKARVAKAFEEVAESRLPDPSRFP